MLTTESFTAHLDDLLERICTRLEISPTQHRLADDHYLTIGRWLEADESPLASFQPVIYPQGSLRIGTTVRPIARQEYDLDLVCELQINWQLIKNPLLILNAVEARLRQHDTYRDMLERKNRCIRVNYANEFHLDILPACPDPKTGANCVVVPDRKAEAWKPSCPKGYAQWFETRAALLRRRLRQRMEPLPAQQSSDEKAPLKHVVQLVKRWRDIEYAKTTDVAPISIVLTTLAGSHYKAEESVNDAVSRVLNGIVASIPQRGRLIVLNPANPAEDLSERWDGNPDAYAEFVRGIREFQNLWAALQSARGIHSVKTVLAGLFGEDVTNRVVEERAKGIERLRLGGELGIQKATGHLTTSACIGAVPVVRNTFYGE